MGGPQPETTLTVFDARGDLMSQTNPAGDSTSSTYSAAGFDLSDTDARGIVSDTVYNGAGDDVEDIADANTSTPKSSTSTLNAAGRW